MPRKGQSSPNEFYILHVEDEPDTYESRVKDAVNGALAFYGMKDDLVVWDFARNRDEALAHIARAETTWPDRPYDAVICDLKIPTSTNGPVDWSHGFQIVQQVSGKKWHCAIIVATSFSKDDEVLKFKEELCKEQDVRIDEFLGKNTELGAGQTQLAVAKLRRTLVPTEMYVRQCRDAGFLVINAKQKDVLREIVYLAKKRYREWPLAKILLLGDMGCGKNEFAKAFQRLLPEPTGGRETEELLVMNCASILTSDLSGRTELFGAGNLNVGGNPINQPGCFEMATSYHVGKDTNGLALRDPLRKGPDYERAGVVLLDEFAEMDPKVQAMILNAMNEGRIQRTGSRTDVAIGCHVILATNFTPAKLSGTGEELDEGKGRVRADLINRIPHVFRIPSLRERQDEIVPLIEFMATRKNGVNVGLNESAGKMVQLAVGHEIITSIRDLQSIADVDPGETIISDSNLTAVVRKAEALGKREVIAKSSEEKPVDEKAAILALPDELQRDDLPKSTRWIIERMYQVKLGLASKPRSREFPDQETEYRFVMTGKFLPNKLTEEIWGTIGAHKALLSRTNKVAYQFDAKNQDEYTRAIIQMLLKEPG
jgi:DNA-binding NtrC family response regulator